MDTPVPIEASWAAVIGQLELLACKREGQANYSAMEIADRALVVISEMLHVVKDAREMVEFISANQAYRDSIEDARAAMASAMPMLDREDSFELWLNRMDKIAEYAHEQAAAMRFWRERKPDAKLAELTAKVQRK